MFVAAITRTSVLSTEKAVTAKTLSRFLPENNLNRLPVLAASNGHGQQEFANEREILYKLFFDMKKDVTELKKMFFEVIQNPAALHQNTAMVDGLKELHAHEYPSPMIVHPMPAAQSAQPVIMPNDIHDHVEVEESLNIMDKERELIIKALKKHKGKRKDAAMDLGISERTLYRKLKEYSIDE